MQTTDARHLLKLRNAAIERHVTAEAYVTAWFTAFLDRSDLLLTTFKPQVLSVASNKRLGAGEYDFASLDAPERAVIVEIKANHRSHEQLKDTLYGQAFAYAMAERRFRKGIIVVTNGFECVWQAAYCSSKKRSFRPSQEPCFLRLDSPDSLITLARDILQPKETFIDQNIAQSFPTSTFLNTVRGYYHGTQAQLWQELLDQVRDIYQWDRRSNTKTNEVFQLIINDLKRHQGFRDIAAARAIIKVLSRPEYKAGILKCLREEFGDELNTEKVLTETMKNLKRLSPRS
jgi:hypothetical protein